MVKFRRTALLACVTVALWVPLASYAAPNTMNTPYRLNIVLSPSPTPETTNIASQSMMRSEKAIDSLLAEQNKEKQIKLFSALIKPRLLYATSRSLCGRESGWMAFVDIYQNYSNNKPIGFKIQQGTVQYGLPQLPTDIKNVTLSIGSDSFDLGSNKRLLFRFPSSELGKDALTSDVDVSILYSDKTVLIPMVQEYPGIAPSIDKALAAMTPAYVTFAQDEHPLPIDHAFLRLRSYVRNTSTFERSYVWELYLIHKTELPAQATILRWDVFSNSTSVSLRELNEYL